MSIRFTAAEPVSPAPTTNVRGSPLFSLMPKTDHPFAPEYSRMAKRLAPQTNSKITHATIYTRKGRRWPNTRATTKSDTTDATNVTTTMRVASSTLAYSHSTLYMRPKPNTTTLSTASNAT